MRKILRHLFLAGVLILLFSPGTFAFPSEAQLLENETATTDGTWVRVDRQQGLSVHIMGITTATVVINGSNAVTKPANTIHHIELATTTTDQLVAIDVPLNWIKVRISSYSDGTISAYLGGLR